MIISNWRTQTLGTHTCGLGVGFLDQNCVFLQCRRNAEKQNVHTVANKSLPLKKSADTSADKSVDVSARVILKDPNSLMLLKSQRTGRQLWPNIGTALPWVPINVRIILGALQIEHLKCFVGAVVPQSTCNGHDRNFTSHTTRISHRPVSHEPLVLDTSSLCFFAV